MQSIRLVEPARASRFFTPGSAVGPCGWPLVQLASCAEGDRQFRGSAPCLRIPSLSVQHIFGGPARRSIRCAGRPCKTFLQGLSGE